jgi:hypothetical protein
MIDDSLILALVPWLEVGRSLTTQHHLLYDDLHVPASIEVPIEEPLTVLAAHESPAEDERFHIPTRLVVIDHVSIWRHGVTVVQAEGAAN